jgi:hypothetical protein
MLKAPWLLQPAILALSATLIVIKQSNTRCKLVRPRRVAGHANVGTCNAAQLYGGQVPSDLKPGYLCNCQSFQQGKTGSWPPWRRAADKSHVCIDAALTTMEGAAARMARSKRFITVAGALCVAICACAKSIALVQLCVWCSALPPCQEATCVHSPAKPATARVMELKRRRVMRKTC